MTKTPSKHNDFGGVYGIIQLMKTNKIHAYYNKNERGFQLKISNEYEQEIARDESVRILSNVMEELD